MEVFFGFLGKRHGNLFRVEFTIGEVWKYSQASKYLRRLRLEFTRDTLRLEFTGREMWKYTQA